MIASLPALSVVVPVYNSGKFLRLCLDSLIAQDCRDIEFICVDDGSTDGSGDVLDDWAAGYDHVKVIHQPNGGYGKAMNLGLSLARGTYIGIVEPDDWIEPHMYSTLLKIACKTGADAVKGDYFGESCQKSRVSGKYKKYKGGEVLSPLEFPEYLLGSVSVWSGIYRRELLEENGIRFNETPGASFQDLGFAVRVWAKARTMSVTPKPLYHYREDNPDSSTRRREDGAWAVLREIEKLQDVFDAIPYTDRLSRTYLIRRVFHSFQADFKLRVSDTLTEFLLRYSELLKKLCPRRLLLQECFDRREWHDLRVLYACPKLYPLTRRSGASILQRIFSVRVEGGRRYVRLLGTRFALPGRR